MLNNSKRILSWDTAYFVFKSLKDRDRKKRSPIAASANCHKRVRRWYTEMVAGVCPCAEISLFYDVIAMGLYKCMEFWFQESTHAGQYTVQS